MIYALGRTYVVSTDSNKSKLSLKKLHRMALETRSGGVFPAPARFTHEKFHYMEAYRAHIKELHGWTAGKSF
jgi:hypothetical protein